MNEIADATENQVTKETLAAELHAVVNDAEELLEATASQSGEEASAARTKIMESLSAAKMRLSMMQASLVDKTKEAVRATDQIVRENPWKAVGIAAASGLLLGIVVRRR